MMRIHGMIGRAWAQNLTESRSEVLMMMFDCTRPTTPVKSQLELTESLPPTATHGSGRSRRPANDLAWQRKVLKSVLAPQ